MAVPRPTKPKRENLPALASKDASLTPLQRLTPMQKRLVIWMASGKPASKFALKHAKEIVPKSEGDLKKVQRKARARVRSWTRTELFRQALWDWSVADIDLATPEILKGIVSKAAAGRVDAARLALEISGRHAPNSDVQPAAIQIVLNNVPRPQAAVEVIDGDAEEIAPDDEAL